MGTIEDWDFVLNHGLKFFNLSEKFLGKLITSWPLGLIVLVLIFRKQFERLINTISGFLSKQKDKDVDIDLLKGKMKAGHKPVLNEDFEQIRQDYRVAVEEIGKHKTEKDQLINYALSLIDDLVDARNAALFERILRFIKNWQLFLLSEGRTNNTISLSNILTKLKNLYPDFEIVISQDDINQTLNGLVTIEMIQIDGDKITFLERYYKFANYLGWVQ